MNDSNKQGVGKMPMPFIVCDKIKISPLTRAYFRG